MKAKTQKVLGVLCLVTSLLFGYFIWLSLRPVEIIAVHYDGNFSHILVRNFPFTDKGKINWWLKNKEILKEKYKIPSPSPYGSFTVNFWDFGNGYKEEDKYDRRCFDDMKTNKNCIDKNLIFSIKRIKDSHTLFIVYDGANYRSEKDGSIVRLKDE